MPASCFAALHRNIASIKVMVPVAGLPNSPSPPMYGVHETLGLIRDPLVDEATIDSSRVGVLSAAVHDACGPSRSRLKAGAAALLLAHSLASAGVRLGEASLRALGAALGLSADLGRCAPYEWAKRADSWLAGDIDGIATVEVVLLRILHAAAAGCAKPATIRRAIFAVLCWFGWQGASPSALAVNVFGVVLGVMEADTGEVTAETLRTLLGGDPTLARQTAALDADERAKGQVHGSRALASGLKKIGKAADARQLRRIRARRPEAYEALRSNILGERMRRSSQHQTNRFAQWHAEAADGIWSSWNAPKLPIPCP